MKTFMRFLSSPVCFFYLVGGWVAYYVTTATWHDEAFALFVEGLDKNPLIQALFVVFLLSGLCNLIRASIAWYRKSPFGFLLRVFLPAGALVFMLGFFMSASLRQSERTLVGEDMEVQSRWQKEALTVRSVDAAFGGALDSVGEPGALKYLYSAGAYFSHEPKAVLADDGESFEVGAFPPKRIKGTYYHILNFGLAPGIRLSRGEDVVLEDYMALQLLPPGAEDRFELPLYPYKFVARLAPLRVISKGRTEAGVYDFKSPNYALTVIKGEEVLFDGETGAEGVSFDGMRLSFFEPAHWVLLETAKDPGLAVIVFGLALMAAGAPLRAIHLLLWAFKRA